jgi:hypothetical protein
VPKCELNVILNFLISEEDGIFLFTSVTVLNVLSMSHCISDTYRVAIANLFLFAVLVDYPSALHTRTWAHTYTQREQNLVVVLIGWLQDKKSYKNPM